MAANVGGIDRAIRIVAGLVLIALFFTLAGTARYVAGVLGLVALGTGLIKVCPLYSVLGINTGAGKKP